MSLFLTYLMTEVVSSFYSFLDVGREAKVIPVDTALTRRGPLQDRPACPVQPNEPGGPKRKICGGIDADFFLQKPRVGQG